MECCLSSSVNIPLRILSKIPFKVDVWKVKIKQNHFLTVWFALKHFIFKWLCANSHYIVQVVAETTSFRSSWFTHSGTSRVPSVLVIWVRAINRCAEIWPGGCFAFERRGECPVVDVVAEFTYTTHNWWLGSLVLQWPEGGGEFLCELCCDCCEKVGISWN